MSENVPENTADVTLSQTESRKRERVNKPRPRQRSRLLKAASFIGLIFILLLGWYFVSSKPNQAANRTRGEVVPVEIATATQTDVPIQIKSIGNVEAVSTIAVRSQVEGSLQAVHFTPGQDVKKGDLLFTIDPRPSQATVSQAQANLAKAVAAVSQGRQVLAKDQATARNSRTIAKRDLVLIESGVISREEYDDAVAKAEADDATVRADQASIASLEAAARAEQANVRNAQVQLGYTAIRAPISGKTGNLVVTQGNLVRADDTTPLVTITQSSPIYVTFNVPEPDFLRIREYANASDFRTEASIPGSPGPAQAGKLSLIDNTVDTTTGTIRLKATFENSDRTLYPGLFANVVLTLGTKHEAVVVPTQAVQIGQDNSFVYVVKPDMTVEVRRIKTANTFNDMTIIDEGLKPGEQVVTDGQLRLVPGATVQARSTQPRGNRPEQGAANPGSGNGANIYQTSGKGSK